jgi:hypothetical protein
MTAAILQQVPSGRFGDAEQDIGPIAVFLASEMSGYMSGNTVFADGGSHVTGSPGGRKWRTDGEGPFQRQGRDRHGRGARRRQGGCLRFRSSAASQGNDPGNPEHRRQKGGCKVSLRRIGDCETDIAAAAAFPARDAANSFTCYTLMVDGGRTKVLRTALGFMTATNRHRRQWPAR